MKLIIQIPCFNEATSLPMTVRDLPTAVEGFDSVEYLVIDDGSTDATAEVAVACGVHHVIRLHGHQGLARAFVAGVLAALEHGADVVVNTDADNQYDARFIPALVAPVLRGEADVVVGARPISSLKHFSRFKRSLQRLGSRAVRALSGKEVGDATCGFRALSREAALRVQVFGSFTYTLETVLQAAASNLRVMSVPISVNGPTRPSRLFRSNMAYVWRSLATLLSVYVIYRPVRLFGVLGLLCLLPASALAVRYVVLMLSGEGVGHVQSVIASGVLALAAIFFFSVGIVAHLLSINRRILEEICFRARQEYLSPLPAPIRAPRETPTFRGAKGDDSIVAFRTAKGRPRQDSPAFESGEIIVRDK